MLNAGSLGSCVRMNMSGICQIMTTKKSSGQQAVLEEGTCLWNDTMTRNARSKGSIIIKTKGQHQNSVTTAERCIQFHHTQLLKAVCLHRHAQRRKINMRTMRSLSTFPNCLLLAATQMGGIQRRPCEGQTGQLKNMLK